MDEQDEQQKNALEFDRDDCLKHVGFDYAQTIRKLRAHLSDEEIGRFMGYAGDMRKSVQNIVGPKRAIPSHPKAEMLWALHVVVFKDKPPMTEAQRRGIKNTSFESAVQAALKKKGGRPLP